MWDFQKRQLKKRLSAPMVNVNAGGKTITTLMEDAINSLFGKIEVVMETEATGKLIILTQMDLILLKIVKSFAGIVTKEQAVLEDRRYIDITITKGEYHDINRRDLWDDCE